MDPLTRRAVYAVIHDVRENPRFLWSVFWGWVFRRKESPHYHFIIGGRPRVWPRHIPDHVHEEMKGHY